MPDQCENQQMGRVEDVEEPFGESSALFGSLAVIEAGDANTGHCHGKGGNGRVQDADVCGHPSVTGDEGVDAIQDSGDGKGNFLFGLGILAPNKQQGKYRRTEGPVAFYRADGDGGYQQGPPKGLLDPVHYHTNQEAQQKGKEHVEIHQAKRSRFGKCEGIGKLG